MAAYLIDYVNKKEFKQLEKSLKIYNVEAYNFLLKKCYPSFKKGDFFGKITHHGNKIVSYEFYLNADCDIKLTYSVYNVGNIVILNTITPTARLLGTYEIMEKYLIQTI